MGRSTTSKGTCTEAAGTVTCALGSSPCELRQHGDHHDRRAPQLRRDVADVRERLREPARPRRRRQHRLRLDDGRGVAPRRTRSLEQRRQRRDLQREHCSLREAINAANANPGRDTILFKLTGSKLIQPSSPGLPIIGGPVVIDATSDPGFAGSPVIVLSGDERVRLRRPSALTGGDSELSRDRLQQLVPLGRSTSSAGATTGLPATGSASTPAGTTRAELQLGDLDRDVEQPGRRIDAADRNVVSGSSLGVRVGSVKRGGPAA